MGLYKNNSGTLAPIAGTPASRLDGLQEQINDLTNNTVKNLLDTSNYSTSLNGVTVTRNSDGIISLSGTFTGSTGNWIYLGEYTLKAGKGYILSGAGKVSSNDGILGGLTNMWSGSKVSTSTTTELYGDSEVYTPSTDELLYFGIRMVNGTNYSGLTYKPMLREASIEDNTYEPYAMTNRELTERTLNDEEVDITYTTNMPANSVSARKNGNIVSVKVFHTSPVQELGTSTTYGCLGILPVGMRPKSTTNWFKYLMLNNNTFGQLTIEGNGQVSIGFTQDRSGTPKNIPTNENLYIEETFII